MKVICGEHWRGSAVLVTAYFFTQGCPILPAALTSIAADLGVRPESVGTAVSVQSAVLGAAFFFSGVLADRLSRPLLAVAGSDGCLSATSVVLGLSAGAIAGVLLGGPLLPQLRFSRSSARSLRLGRGGRPAIWYNT